MSDKITNFESNILKDNLINDNAVSDDRDLDELLNDLEEDDDEFMARYREQRIEQISSHLKKVEKNVREQNYGIVEVISQESRLINMSTQIDNIIIHFEIPTFPKCVFMDNALESLARKYLDSKFVKINVENCPFLVDKLQIKVLPFVVGYKKGVEALRLTGFSELGNDPNGFPLVNLEKRLLSVRLIKSTGRLTQAKINNINNSSDDSDLDL